MANYLKNCSLLLALAASRALAGTVVHDGSLGPNRTLNGPNFIISPSDGKQVGGNLFHSFRTLNLNAGDTANFTGPTSVRNVLARVTDGAISEIDGTIRSTIPGANLFLMNPAGVIFGPNSALDIDGAFVATTADVIKLADGGKFAGDTVANNSVLTSADPSAFGFLKAQPSPMVIVGDFDNVTRARLTTKPQKTLSIVGGEIATGLGEIRSPGGRINLISVGGTGEVTGDLVSIDAPPPNLDAFDRLGAVSLNGLTLLSVSGAPSGRVVVRGASLTMDVQSSILAANDGPIDSPAVAIVLVLRDRIDLAGGASIATTNSGSGAGGDIRAFARVATLSNSDTTGGTITRMNAFSFGDGPGGNIVGHFRRLNVLGNSNFTTSAASNGA
ncbi:MAG: filamentous hemagglutinin N-terminal domain-containing protein, partial [Anaerolineae bacterium]|nr:filamentous hemagglutinin N-terminal domain-containing protein [Phycisphaerae bacterium]